MSILCNAAQNRASYLVLLIFMKALRQKYTILLTVFQKIHDTIISRSYATEYYTKLAEYHMGYFY